MLKIIESSKGCDYLFLGACRVSAKEAVAEAEEGSFHDDMEEPSAQKGGGEADPEGGVGVFPYAKAVQGLMSEVNDLFMREIDRIGQVGDPPGEGRRIAIEQARGA
jgi:hypothetical protein